MTFRERMYPMGYLENVVKQIIMQNNKVKKWWLSLMIIICVIFSAWHYLKYRWKDILSPATYMVPYAVNSNYDDTLRVIMIGDSWAGLHKELECEDTLADMISHIVHKPVTVKTNGRGGAKSKDVYFLMFKETASKVDTDPNYCTQPLIQNGADYCIISIGANDASANLGTNYLCTNCDLVIKHLIYVGITPVLIEVPQRNDMSQYSGKPWNHYLVDRIRAFMTGSDMYIYDKYRLALYNHLVENGLMDSIIYIKKDDWNIDGYKDQRNLYMQDGMHLNKRGYWFLDSCLADRISRHFKASLSE